MRLMNSRAAQVIILKSHRYSLGHQKSFNILDGVGAEMEDARSEDVIDIPQSFSVGVKGSPRSPLKSFFSRLSLELLLRRVMPGATRWLNSRR
jgi:hypothetical protein